MSYVSVSPLSLGLSSSTTVRTVLPSTTVEIVALGGSFWKSSLPLVQFSTNLVVETSPVMRSGRSVNMSVCGATPLIVSVLPSVLKPSPTCTNIQLAAGIATSAAASVWAGASAACALPRTTNVATAAPSKTCLIITCPSHYSLDARTISGHPCVVQMYSDAVRMHMI